MNTRVRRMEKSDIPAAETVESACFSDPWSEDIFNATLLLPYASYYIAEVEGENGWETAGICGVRRLLDEGEITNVGVLPDHRKCGIARQMLNVLIREASELGTKDFTLEVRAGNTPAIRLYESLGFVTEGVRRGFYEKPKEDALIMWRRN